jgi:hypothetical protein
MRTILGRPAGSGLGGISRSLSVAVLVALASQACASEDKDDAGTGGGAGISAGGAAGSAAGVGGDAGGPAAGAGGDAGGPAAGAGGDAGGPAAGAGGNAGGPAAGAGGNAGGPAAGAGGDAGGPGAGAGGDAGAPAAGAGGAAGNAGAGGGGGAGGSDVLPQDAGIKFLGEASKEIPKGEAFAPSNFNGIAPFSTGVVSVGIANTSGAELTIESVEIVLAAGLKPEEIRQSKPGSTLYQAVDLAGTKIAADGSATLGLHFWPFASGPRNATIIVKTSDGKQASFELQGRGRDNLVLSPTVSVESEKVYAVAPGKVSFFDVGGAIADDADGLIFSGNARELYDKFNPDLALIHTKADGSVAWAKSWNETFHQKVPDPNAETGGGADQIANGGDGYVYYGASRSTDSSNAEPGSFQALVYKVKIADGSMAWAKGLRNGTIDQAWAGFMGYTLDASLPDRVIVAGYSDGNKWAFAAIKKSDGSIIYSRTLDITPGSAGKIYSVRVGADGVGYFGGEAASRAHLARITGLDTDSPAVDWVAATGGGIGTRIDSIDLTEEGDALTELFIGGATRSFAVARYKKDATLTWSKTWGDTNSLNTARVVRRHGGSVYVGGKMSLTTFDQTSGDGFMLVLDVATGAYKTGGAYYTGKTTTTIAAHSIKGFVFQGESVYTVMDGYPGSNNSGHYWGFWYQPPTEKLDLPLEGKDGSERLTDFNPGTLAKVAGVALKRFPKSSGVEGDPGKEVTVYDIDTSTIWKDIDSADAGFYDAKTYEHGPVGHFNVQKLKVTELFRKISRRRFGGGRMRGAGGRRRIAVVCGPQPLHRPPRRRSLSRRRARARSSRRTSGRWQDRGSARRCHPV